MKTLTDQVLKSVCLGSLLLGSCGTALAGDAWTDDSQYGLRSWCAPLVLKNSYRQPYKNLYKTLEPFVNRISADVAAFESSPDLGANGPTALSNYNKLVNGAIAARNKLTGVPGPRILIAESDGTVLVDTNNTAPVAPTCTARANSVPCFKAKNVQENHNSRVAIFDAQAWPCGIGLETKFSSSVQKPQSYVAIRLYGPGTSSTVASYLNSYGTVRISQDVNP